MARKPASDTAVLDAPEALAAPTIKWASWPGNNGMNVPATTAQVGVITGTGTGGQAPGAVATGDLLIIAAHAGKAGGIGEYTISGTGWTQILHSTAGDNEIKLFVWWKIADASDVTAAGVYTVTWGGTSPEAFSWAEWNFGQNAFIDAWNGLWSNVLVSAGGNALNPGCFPTGNADTLLTYWFDYHDNTNWVLPGGLTQVFRNTQGGLPSQGASGTKVLSAAGFTGNLNATIGTLQQYGAFQIAISTGSPPNGGGGNSPIKWLSFMATQPTLGTVSSVVIGTTAPAQTLGPFATGDLYVVAVSVEADTGVTGTLSISGSGWTNLVATAAGAPLNTRMSVWAKVVGGGETGIYTVSWPNATGNPNWVAYNLGQATIDLAAGQCLAPTGGSLVAPTITTTAANEAVLAYWFLVDTTGPGVGIVAPTTAGFTPLAINLTASFKWDMTTGVILAPTAGATGNMTATGPSGMPVYSAFQLAYKPTAGGGGSPPPVPTGLTATAVSSSQINLSWSASTGATTYNVLRGGSTVGTPSGTTFNDTGLTASTSYTYRVQAVSAGGTSASSGPVSATTLAPGASPFPAFTPQLPPPPVGTGGSVAIVIPPAPVPPSVAGIAQPVFTFGNATTPPASAAFPEFTTTYPHPPVIINSTQNTNTPIWVAPPQPPPSQATTPPLGTSYNTGGIYGPPRGPALPPVVPGGTRPFMVATNGNPDDVVYPEEDHDQTDPEPDPEPEPEPEPNPDPERNGNGVVYDDSSEENEDWFEETPSRPTSDPPKPKRGRGRRK